MYWRRTRWPGPLGATSATSTSGGRLDLAVVDREAVAEQQQVAGRDAVGDLLAVDLAVLLVGQQHHHDVAARGGLGDVEHLEAGVLRLRDRGGVGPQAYDDVDAGVLEVQRVGVALRAVADDGDGLAVEEREVCVVVVEHAARQATKLASMTHQISVAADARGRVRRVHGAHDRLVAARVHVVAAGAAGDRDRAARGRSLLRDRAARVPLRLGARRDVRAAGADRLHVADQRPAAAAAGPDARAWSTSASRPTATGRA